MVSQLTHKRVVLGLCFCLALAFSGCTVAPSSTSSTGTETSSSTGSATTTSTSNVATPSSTTPNSSVSGLDGESADTNTPSSESENSSTPTPNPTPGVSVDGKGGAALLSNLKNAGFSGEKLRLAWSIGMAESGGDPRAFNGNTRTGDQSYGLFQINMLGAMGPERRRQLNLQSNDELFDPQVNIRAMLRISSNGTNWKPWSAYKNGSYRRFYDKFKDS